MNEAWTGARLKNKLALQEQNYARRVPDLGLLQEVWLLSWVPPRLPTWDGVAR